VAVPAPQHELLLQALSAADTPLSSFVAEIVAPFAGNVRGWGFEGTFSVV
jgi:hypothetical protein